MALFFPFKKKKREKGVGHRKGRLRKKEENGETNVHFFSCRNGGKEEKKNFRLVSKA